MPETQANCYIKFMFMFVIVAVDAVVFNIGGDGGGLCMCACTRVCVCMCVCVCVCVPRMETKELSFRSLGAARVNDPSAVGKETRDVAFWHAVTMLKNNLHSPLEYLH